MPLPLCRAHIYSLQVLLKLSSHSMWSLPESLQSLHFMRNCVSCTVATCSSGEMGDTCSPIVQQGVECFRHSAAIVVHKSACCAAGAKDAAAFAFVLAAKSVCLVSSAGVIS